MAEKKATVKNGLTVLVVPHDDSQTLSFKLPLWLLQTFVIITAVILAGTFFLIRGYLLRTEQVNELHRLREVNQVQEEQINLMTQETDNLVKMMEELESLSMQIRDLMSSTSADVNAIGGGNGVQVASRGESVYDRAQENLRILQSTLPDQLVKLDDLKGDLVSYNRRMDATPTHWPVRGWITSRFGSRKHPITGASDFHNAIDIGTSYGTRIYAAASGRVVKAQYSSSYGRLIIIDHGYGFQTYYAHQSSFAVEKGEWVTKGELIGYVGSSGSATGPHLHFEVRVNGVPVNPLNYLD